MPITWREPVQRKLRGRARHELGQAEIGDFHLAAFVQQDVLGLDIAMDDPFFMGVLQGLANLGDDCQCLLRLQTSALDEMPQIAPVDELHDQVKQAARFAEIVDGDDVGMAEPGQGAGFASKAFGKGRIATPLGRQDLDSHLAIQLDLPGPVDGAHAALADQFLDFELREKGSQIGWRWRAQ